MGGWVRQSKSEAFSRDDPRYITFIPVAVLLGIFSGSVAVAFHLSLDAAIAIRNQTVEWLHHTQWNGFWLVLLGSAITTICAALLVAKIEPAAGGAGIPHLKGVLLGVRRYRPLRLISVKFLSGLIGIMGGLTLGREGPTVQMGGAVGDFLGHRLKRTKRERLMLIMAGSGAGLTAAFNSPLSGVMFTLEELRTRAGSLELFVTAIACLVADTFCRYWLGQLPVLRLVQIEAPKLEALPVFLGLGLLAGLTGVLFNLGLIRTQSIAKTPLRVRFLIWVLVGFVIGCVMWFHPQWTGTGQHLLQGLLDGSLPESIQTLGIIFLLRWLLLYLSYGTGSAGGFFFPLLVLGGVLGSVVAMIAIQCFPLIEIQSACVVLVGMASLFAASTRAPLTAMILMIEMSGNYGLILPLFLATFTAVVVADMLGAEPIYEALLKKDLEEGPKRMAA
jgi:CIC family chloride channel protein